MRLALVGAGGCAELVAASLTALGGIELVAVASPNDAGAFATRWGIPRAFKDYRSLLEDVPVQAVVVAAPTDLHYDVCIAAAEAGVPVLCPSPLVVGLGEAELLQELFRRGTLRLAMLNPEYAALAVAVEEGRPSRVRWRRRAPPPEGWRGDPDRAGGGVLMDLGAAAVLALLRLFGSLPNEVKVEVRRSTAAGGEPLDAAVVAWLRFRSGEMAELDLAWEPSTQVDAVSFAGDGGRERVLDLTEAAWRAELLAAVGRHHPDWRLGLEALETVAACYEAAAAGGPVPVAPRGRLERAIDHWSWLGEVQASGR